MDAGSIPATYTKFMPRKKKPLKRYLCSFAVDVPEYSDFIIKATSEIAAKRIINKALRLGRFELVTGEPCLENACNERVFILRPGEADDDDHFPTLDKLCSEKDALGILGKPKL